MNPRSAIKVLSRCVRRKNTDAGPYLWLAQAWLATSRPEKARAVLDDAIGRLVDDGSLIALRGQVYRQTWESSGRRTRSPSQPRVPAESVVGRRTVPSAARPRGRAGGRGRAGPHLWTVRSAPWLSLSGMKATNAGSLAVADVGLEATAPTR